MGRLEEARAAAGALAGLEEEGSARQHGARTVRASATSGGDMLDMTWVLAETPPPPKWTEIVGAVNGTLTFLALVIGGTVGYLRFLKTRKMHASCALKVEAKA